MIKQQLLGKPERGGVSIFIVIFTALLMTIVTTSFVQIMVRNQQQATNNDLSQSAYDAALAGVEDAKRALIKLKNCQGDASSVCNNVRAAFRDSADLCDFLDLAITADFNNGEVQVGDQALNQAYTCVKIKTDTPSVLDNLLANTGSQTVRLQGTDPFTRIRISWYTDQDIRDANGGVLYGATDPRTIFPSLPASTGWESAAPGISTPPMMRAQLIQFDGGDDIDLSAFSSSDTRNARTTFLYPSFLAGSSTTPQPYFNDDTRLSGSSNTPGTAHCTAINEYKCSVILSLPDPEGGSESSREAYLQLAALYNATSFKIELLNSSNNVINFDNVQPVVDSTGRAADLFRRVKANISIDDINLPVPDAALSVNGDLCKNFIVTNNAGEYATRCTTP